jgi:hypothetical protein
MFDHWDLEFPDHDLVESAMSCYRGWQLRYAQAERIGRRYS